MNSDSLGGQVLCGRYKVVETLKPGGMARVYKVVDTTSNRTLALKLPTSSSNEALAVLAFDRELEALENLQHPSIVELVDAGRTERQELYLALEWLPTCLNEQLIAGNRWTWEDFYVDVGAPLVSALAAAHRRDIAHRDIKPENLRFDEFGRLTVTDFGIAKARSGAQIGETFRAAGSPPYTPPEIDDGTNSFARDSFSWATVALACLSGRTFTNLGEVKDSLAALTQDAAPISLLESCLSLTPKERPANGTDLQAQVEAFHRKYVDRRPLQITVQLSPQALSELAQKLGGRSPDDCVSFLQGDLSRSLHGYIVSEQDRSVRFIGATLDVTCKAVDNSELFRVISARVLELDRAESERRQASELHAITLTVLAPMAPTRGAANQRAFWLRLQTEESHRQREIDKAERERWFDCWAAVLREKDRIQRTRKLSIPFVTMRARNEKAVAVCEGEISEDRLPDRLVFRPAFGRPFLFEVLDVFGDEITLKPLNLDVTELPRGSGVLESNEFGQSQPVARQRIALETVRRERAASPALKSLLCEPEKARLPEPGGIPSGYANDLNGEKRELIERALGLNSILMVEGPPGTGKTTFIAELIALYLHVFPAARVLLSSQTHTALDHVLIKLIEKNLSHDVVRIHGERIEKIDNLARPLILDLKTRSWIERVEERARKYVKERAEQLGLDTTEVEVVVLGEQRQILLEELRSYEKELAAVLSEGPTSSAGESDASDEEAINKTSTLIDKREHLDDQIKAIKRRLAKVDGKLKALGDFGEAIASSSDEVSREWMDALSKSHVHGAEFLKSQVGLQLEWFARLGVSRDFHGAVLGEARVVAGTCVGLASVPAFSELEFDLCIVDEVSKATPTETLIPMSRSKRWVLVGDPQQLPPYSELDRKKVLDQRYPIEEAEATLLDILTTRLPDACKAQLKEQRRMVTSIGNLVSDVFYDSKLVSIRTAEDRDPVTAKLHPLAVEWHTTSNIAKRREQEMTGRTYRNPCEAAIVHQVLERLNAGNRGRKPLNVAVIAGYSAQVNELGQRIQGAAKPLQNLKIVINTVDAFQGKDADICIYSVTRSNAEHRLGFQREVQRLNVALSRGRDSLIIVGDDMFCRGITSKNPFLKVLAHIDNHTDECGFVRYDRV